ncbi:MAG: hypothetical protein PHE51_03545 [Eubacteriales bacterium]|nr:hypothetical protein [Eubacteriales bacterium]
MASNPKCSKVQVIGLILWGITINGFKKLRKMSLIVVYFFRKRRIGVHNSLSYRASMEVYDTKKFATRDRDIYFPVCPRCSMTIEREFMSYCDRCGQRLNWNYYQGDS